MKSLGNFLWHFRFFGLTLNLRNCLLFLLGVTCIVNTANAVGVIGHTPFTGAAKENLISSTMQACTATDWSAASSSYPDAFRNMSKNQAKEFCTCKSNTFADSISVEDVQYAAAMDKPEIFRSLGIKIENLCISKVLESQTKDSPKKNEIANSDASPSAMKKSMSPSVKIPSKFWGEVWTNEAGHCPGADVGPLPLSINGNNINQWEQGCNLVKGISSDDAFSGKFSCNDSGEESTIFIKLKIKSKDSIIVTSELDGANSSQTFFRCNS